MNAKMLVSGLLALGLACPAVAEDIYRWVDDNGVVHYSDVPNDTSEAVELQPTPTFSLPPTQPAARSRAAAADSDEEDVAGYEGLTIVSPAEEDTIWNTGGVITVEVRPQPALKDGHSVRMYYNGDQIEGSNPRDTSVEISGVVRGTHKISAEIRNQAGDVLATATPVTFYYKQTTARLDGTLPLNVVNGEVAVTEPGTVNPDTGEFIPDTGNRAQRLNRRRPGSR